MNKFQKNLIFILFIFFTSIICGCGPSIKILEKDLGKLSISDFDEIAKSKGYGRWNYKEYYNYKLIGWNKFGAMPFYAVFDEKDLLVEYLDNNVDTIGWAVKNVDLEKIKSLQLAREKSFNEEQRKRNRELKEEQERRLAKLEEEKERKAKELQEEQEKIARQKPILDKLNAELLKVDKPYICKDETSCKKAFTLTQIFISEYSEMKIQIATDAIIETYSSKDSISMKAVKVPSKGSHEVIFLNINVPWFWNEIKEKTAKIKLLKLHNNLLKSGT